MQKSHSLHSLALAVALRWTLIRSIDFMPVGWVGGIITTGTAVPARSFRAGRGFIAPGDGVQTGRCSAATGLRRRRYLIALTWCTAVLSG
jgi:hypothetical protein